MLNLGYIAINLTTWNKINSLEEMISITATRVGSIVLILCVLHYINIFMLYFLRNKLTLK
ncbi:hypothetical protein HMPREF0204_12688 [Chryseobacterium gleum ATCC 35910]|uniref:Uncharacterized protein n=1 Tax=Chryseobacterium gleum ATCC 35910 TaxID=525257 RepID=A0ABN0AKP6_CHRGE|nr:hypothetical protein HMPREF0204_12688 [Chryseobacterium gleum ATCC 35910]